MTETFLKRRYLRPGPYTWPTISGDAPAGLVGAPYSFAYSLASGAPPYTVTLADGALPAGLSLSTAGVISGTPTTEEAPEFTVRVTDANGLWDEVEDSIAVDQVPLPLLASTGDYYTGSPDDLTAGGNMGWAAGIDNVRISPDGIYAAGSDIASELADLFQLRVFTADGWEALPDPDDVPDVGPVALAWSPDGGYLAALISYPNNTGDVWIYKRTGSDFERVATEALGTGASRWSLAWNADGTRIAAGRTLSDDSLYVWDFADDALSNRIQLAGAGTNSIGGSPYRLDWNGDLIACQNATHVFVVDASQSPMPILDSEQFSISVVVRNGCYWVGDYIVLVENDTIHVYEWDGSALSSVSADAILSGTAVDSSIDASRRYIAVAESSAVEIVDLGASVPTPAVVDTLGAADSVSFSEV